MKFRSRTLLPIFIACVSLTSSAISQVKASPLTSRSPQQQFPRISGLTPKNLQDQVNALLAKREQQDRASRQECLASSMPGAPAPTYDQTIRVAYLSSNLLSIDVRASWDGCSAYPNIDMTEPLTIDLRSGKSINWRAFFKEHFFESTGDEGSPMTQLYLQHAQLTPECNTIVNKPLTEYILWLDSQNGMMIRPALPHAIQACAKLISVPFSAITEQIDPAFRQGLSASTRPASSQPAHQIP